MKLADKVVVVTGGATGMGAAMCGRFAQEGAHGVAVADINLEGAEAVANHIGEVATAYRTDVRKEEDIQRLVADVLDRYGRIDVFVTNAGALWGEPAKPGVGVQERGNLWASNAAWQELWDLNAMPQVYAARAVLPHMVERGSGYMVLNASAGALVTTLGNAPYTASKHAALSIAEWISIHYGDAGIGVSCIVSEGVKTDMLKGAQNEWFAAVGAIEPEEAAESVVRALEDETFLVLTHPAVIRYFQGKANDYDVWLSKMRHFHAKTPVE